MLLFRALNSSTSTQKIYVPFSISYSLKVFYRLSWRPILINTILSDFLPQSSNIFESIKLLIVSEESTNIFEAAFFECKIRICTSI
ncbi:MAG: hypothetical protein KDD45_02185 [Bdellovibrionales bacterium]|nr:hypothetical protein [Bdellovibrionales bacterium]